MAKICTMTVIQHHSLLSSKKMAAVHGAGNITVQHGGNSHLAAYSSKIRPTYVTASTKLKLNSAPNHSCSCLEVKATPTLSYQVS